MSLATFTYKYWEPVVSVLNMSSCTLSKYSQRTTFKAFFTFYVIFNYVYMWGKGTSHRRPKKSSDALELVFWAVVSYLRWVLGTELGSSARAECALSCRAISSAPVQQLVSRQ